MSNCATDVQIQRLEKEVEHWKRLAASETQKYQDSHLAFEELNSEFEELQSSSKEIEKELEIQLEQIERRNRDLTLNNQKLTSDNESYRIKLQSLRMDSAEQINRLEIELNRVINERDSLQRCIRDLEQTNDDLERAKRAALASLEDFERRLNDAIERNVFLENELEEKDELQASVQRLKDETRDLKQEIKVKERFNVNEPCLKNQMIDSKSSQQRPISLNLSTPTCNNNNNRSTVNGFGGRTLATRNSIDYAQLGNASQNNSALSSATPFNTSTRISALNIVSDLLRKVGALETKLANSKRLSVENSSLSISSQRIGTVDSEAEENS